MNLCVAIRTNKWTANEQRVFDQLSQALGDAFKVVFHNRASDLELPIDCVDINDSVISEMELRPVADWGWRCGDYAYYALRQAYPDFDHYMLVEPDVYFGGDVSAFFEHLSRFSQDVIGLNIEEFDPNHVFARSVKDVPPKRAIFAMTRFSAKALDYAYQKRKNYALLNIRERVYANDEVFCFSYLLDNSDMEVADFSTISPGWFENVQFDTAPDLLVEHVDRDAGHLNKVIHPVVDRAFFKTALAKRMVGRVGVLEGSASALQSMTKQDLDEIAEIARVQLREHLRRFERSTKEESTNVRN